MMICLIIGGDVMVFVLLGVFVILLSGKSLGRLLDCENANFTDRIVYFIVFPRKLLNLLGFRCLDRLDMTDGVISSEQSESRNLWRI